jgi:hypothetical protein
VASEVVALEIAPPSARVSDFASRTSATRLGNQTWLRTSCSKRIAPYGAISSLTPIGPLRRRPPRHQRRPFRRVAVGLRDCVTATRSARGALGSDVRAVTTAWSPGRPQDVELNQPGHCHEALARNDGDPGSRRSTTTIRRISRTPSAPTSPSSTSIAARAPSRCGGSSPSMIAATSSTR